MAEKLMAEKLMAERQMTDRQIAERQSKAERERQLILEQFFQLWDDAKTYKETRNMKYKHFYEATREYLEEHFPKVSQLVYYLVVENKRLKDEFADYQSPAVCLSPANGITNV
jgi:hypothetical protein